jgi:hypothetical protein
MVTNHMKKNKLDKAIKDKDIIAGKICHLYQIVP